MNRLIACMHMANYMTDFEESVAHVVRRLVSRHMDYSVAQKVFRNVLHKHWQAGGVRKLEPMKWFYSTWRFLNQPMYWNPTSTAWEPIWPAEPTGQFWKIFGWAPDPGQSTPHHPVPVQGTEKHHSVHEMGCRGPKRPHKLLEPHSFEREQMTQPGSTHKPPRKKGK